MFRKSVNKDKIKLITNISVHRVHEAFKNLRMWYESKCIKLFNLSCWTRVNAMSNTKIKLVDKGRQKSPRLNAVLLVSLRKRREIKILMNWSCFFIEVRNVMNQSRGVGVVFLHFLRKFDSSFGLWRCLLSNSLV